MIRYPTLAEVLILHLLVMRQSGGLVGVRDSNALETALAQIRVTFGGKELYPGLLEKAAALCFFIVQGHPFADGNKRTGHAAMETMLQLNGFQIEATEEDQELVMLNVAAGDIGLSAFTTWLISRVRPVGVAC